MELVQYFFSTVYNVPELIRVFGFLGVAAIVFADILLIPGAMDAVFAILLQDTVRPFFFFGGALVVFGVLAIVFRVTNPLHLPAGAWVQPDVLSILLPKSVGSFIFQLALALALMVGFEDAPHTYEYRDHYKILPAIHEWSSDPQRINGGRRVPPDFTYCSDTNSEWMTIDQLRQWIDQNRGRIGTI